VDTLNGDNAGGEVAEQRGDGARPPETTLGGSPRSLVHIRSLIPSLIPSEARVARVLFEHHEELRGWSVGDVARRAHTSRATVVRACQTLGYTGFNDLCAVVEREALSPTSPHHREVGPLAALELTLQAGAEQIESMSAMLDRSEFERAVQVLVEARRVLVVTVSDLAVLGQYAVFHFTLIGRSAEAPTDVVTMHAIASLLEPGDACIAVGHSGTNALTIRIAETAQRAGASVIAITSFARGALVDVADIHLAVGVPNPESNTHAFTRIRIGQMLIIDALQNALSTRLDTRRPAEAMLNTVTQYTYRRPRQPRSPSGKNH
jgi:RpiR family carbohydrate utilization transcriptional regulator